jgi:hypothetical protein
MLQALVDLINLLCFTVIYKVTVRLITFERIFGPSEDEVTEMDEIT